MKNRVHTTHFSLQKLKNQKKLDKTLAKHTQIHQKTVSDIFINKPQIIRQFLRKHSTILTHTLIYECIYTNKTNHTI